MDAFFDKLDDFTDKPSMVATSDYTPRKYPQAIKYMGSKASILEFIGQGLAEVQAAGRPIIDLFAGACSISGGFGHISPILSNDIQTYSAVIASTYLRRAEKIGQFDIVELAQPIVKRALASLPSGLAYPSSTASLEEFNKVERRNRKLINKDFNTSHHLFTRVYSGTWWSAEQCVWIDAIREVLDTLKSENKIAKSDFDFGLTCLLSAMAYTSQGTGHYAQYRDANTNKGMLDILKYRHASVPIIFRRKFKPLLDWNLSNVVNNLNITLATDYVECLRSVRNSVVYADPPYAFVHYSRFYHAMETLVKYDYPQIQHIDGKIVKGRYRVERHQSPFCIKTKVKGAFADLFDGVKHSNSDLVLSYSNTGMIDIDALIDLAKTHLGSNYEVSNLVLDHTHMTMGRSKDRSRQVKESLIIAKNCR